ncbi:IS110 family transposase [uncultured Desulfuromonas sp.]|uniref:IS110 family transposase n=1 Tax=uncultured Desulfuromonas sp. TaxID=181013 RepID=UPI002AAAB634|nr:IS110 family transposase [uncultured Desulfuromonas sp.]
MKISTVGLDLAKNVFHVVGFDHVGKQVMKRMLRRHQVAEFFVNLPPCTVAMEACAGCHYWARKLKEMGHDVKVIPPQYVKPYLRGNKNDYNDACAIAEAATRPTMPTVAVKTVQQQEMQALHRLRSRMVKERTALGNSLRGLLAEFGLIIPQGVSALRRGIPAILEDADNDLSDSFRAVVARSYEHFVALSDQIDFYTQQLSQLSRSDEACVRLQTIPGFGPIVASAFRSAVGDGRDYKRGRDVSASIGLVPRQHSSGGKQNLLGISKRGDRYLRSLLVHGARAVVTYAAGKDDPLSRWINRIRLERGVNKATVALANKMARIGWALLTNGSRYQSSQAAS